MNRINTVRQRFVRHQAGVAIVEFALALPVLMTLFYGVVEVTRFVLITQKVEKLAHTVADTIAQSSTATNATMDQLLMATDEIMKPFDFENSGTVLISSLYRPAGAGDAVVNWRHQGGGNYPGAVSQVGPVGSVPAMPGGFTFDERENVIAVEVFFEFSPLISNQFFGTTVVYRQAFYRPRFGNLTATPS